VVGADSPREGFLPRCSSCSLRVLEHLCFDPVGQWLLVGSGLADSTPGRRGQSALHELLADHLRTWHGPSSEEVLVGSFCLCLTDRPSSVADHPRGARGQSAK
jgi:hypothetical protein